MQWPLLGISKIYTCKNYQALIRRDQSKHELLSKLLDWLISDFFYFFPFLIFTSFMTESLYWYLWIEDPAFI